MTICRILAASLLISPLACEQKPATNAPGSTEAAAVADAPPEAPPAPPPKVPPDAMAVGTFNVDWALDAADEKRTALGLKHRAKTADDWAWKRDAVAKILAAEKLDIVALQELGGERELGDIAWAIKEQGGPQYDWVFVPSDDKNTGQHVGVLSRFPLSNARRLPANMRKQMAADVELPDGQVITVVVVHARTGDYPAYMADRRKQARSVKKVIAKLAKERPTIVLGTFNEHATPSSDGYEGSSVGIFAGAATAPGDDDCQDSGALAGGTTADDLALDRVFSCGLEMRSASVSGRDRIVRGAVDPVDARWAEIPLEAEPYRDVSKHFVLWTEIALPKKPEPAKGGGGDGETREAAAE
jgi:endonuclease/exonuclease/phosphatase family metal-dependent hydrolase